jgi:hypothetical protein
MFENNNETTVTLLTSNGPAVTLDREDAERIAAPGYSLYWINNGTGRHYVYMSRGRLPDGKHAHPAPFKGAHQYSGKHGGHGMPVARVIMQPAPGEKVRYCTSDHSNLRRVNLSVQGAVR